jgi:hypothetical protein
MMQNPSGDRTHADNRSSSAGATQPTLAEQLMAARAERDELLQRDELRRVQEEITALRNRSDIGALGNEDSDTEQNVTESSSGSVTLKRRNPFGQDETHLRRKKGIKPKDPTIYSGASLKQYRDYVRDCELSYKNAPESFPTEEDLVTWAMQFLSGDPKESWWSQYELMQEAGEELTWDCYKQYILDTQLDPVNRGIDAAIQLNKAAQREGQTTRAFATYLGTLEDQLPKYSEPHRVQTLFSKLRQELQLAITNTGTIPLTREGLVILATTKERNLRKTASSTHVKRAQGPSGRQLGDRPAKQPTDKGRAPERSSSIATRDPPTCYSCGKVGHIAPKCPNKPSNPSNHLRDNPNKVPVGHISASSGKA